MNNNQKNHKTIISNGLDNVQVFHNEMKKKFVFSGALYGEVIREMIVNLEKQKLKEGISIEYIQYRENQIEHLVNLYNTVEEILEKYRQMIIALQLTNDALENWILGSPQFDELILSNKQHRDEFLKL